MPATDAENKRAPDIEARRAHLRATHNSIHLNDSERRLSALLEHIALVELIDGRYYRGRLHVIDQSSVILTDAVYLPAPPLATDTTDTEADVNRDNGGESGDREYRVNSVLVTIKHIKSCYLYAAPTLLKSLGDDARSLVVSSEVAARWQKPEDWSM